MSDANATDETRPIPAKPNHYATASLITALIPLAVLALGFLFCLAMSGGQSGDNDRGAIWWVFIMILMLLVPLTVVVNIISIVFGVIGIKKQKSGKTFFTFSGIIVAPLELIIFFVSIYVLM